MHMAAGSSVKLFTTDSFRPQWTTRLPIDDHGFQLLVKGKTYSAPIRVLDINHRYGISFDPSTNSDVGESAYVMNVWVQLPQPTGYSLVAFTQNMYVIELTATFVDEFNAHQVEFTKTWLDGGIVRSSPQVYFSVEKSDAKWDQGVYYKASRIDWRGVVYANQVLLQLPAGTVHTPPQGQASMAIHLIVTLVSSMKITPNKEEVTDITADSGGR